MCRAKPPPVVYTLEDLKNNKWLLPDPTKERGTKSHKSSAYANISKVPPIEGSKIGAGHPQVYYALNRKVPGTAFTCKYSGLKFVKKGTTGGKEAITSDD